MDKISFAKVQKMLNWVWENPYSSFYRDKYKKAGISSWKDIKTAKDFQNIPFLTRQEIVKTNPYDRLFISKENVCSIWISSGTTDSKNPTIILHRPLHPLQKKLFREHTSRLNTKSTLVLFSSLANQARLQEEWGFLKNKDGLIVAGDINNLPLTAQIASQLNLDSIKTTPTILSFFIPYLKKEVDLSQITYIFLGGEFCSEQRLNYFKKIFKNAYFQFNFGSNETQMKGYRCQILAKKSPRFFHPLPIFYFEYLNEQEESEQVITHLFHVAFPLIKYKTGDSVRLEKQSCGCGETQIIEVHGKLEYDVAKISGATLYTNLIEQALKSSLEYLSSPEWQLHLYEKVISNKIMPNLKLYVIPKKHIKNLNTLKDQIEKEVSKNLYISQTSTLSDLVKKGVFLPLEVIFVDSFQKGPKHKRIISHLT